MRQGGLVRPFPSARERLTDGAMHQPATDWEQRYRRTVITSDMVATAVVVASIGNFFGA
ncbi:sugar transferase, partial [Streptomyces sp. NPDC004579]